MHEMSLATHILEIIRQEMKAHGKTKLVGARVCYGVLANVVPESLAFAFEVLSTQTSFAGANLTLQEKPLVLACGTCQKEFSPDPSPVALLAPCPYCLEEVGHSVLNGKELYIDNIEVE